MNEQKNSDLLFPVVAIRRLTEKQSQETSRLLRNKALACLPQAGKDTKFLVRRFFGS